jgi:hypothetical protein
MLDCMVRRRQVHLLLLASCRPVEASASALTLRRGMDARVSVHFG